MNYKTCHVQKTQEGNYDVHLWTDDGYKRLKWSYPAFEEAEKGE